VEKIGLVPEDDGLVSVDEDAVVEVVADAAGQGHALAIASETEQVVGGMEMLHANDLLVDDGALVEDAGDVMAGGADELDASIIGAAVGICADEGGEERMMDIDDAALPCLADLGRDDLHVTGEDDKIDGVLAKEIGGALEAGGLFLGTDGDMLESQALALDHFAEGLVIGDDGCNLHGQLPYPPAPEQIGEAMAQFADEDGGAEERFLLADAPPGFQLRGKRGESFAEAGGIEGDGGGINRHSCEKPPGDGVGELMDLEQIAAMECYERGEPGKEADTVRAGEFQEGDSH